MFQELVLTYGSVKMVCHCKAIHPVRDFFSKKKMYLLLCYGTYVILHLQWMPFGMKKQLFQVIQ